MSSVFEFATARRILFGAGKLAEVPAALATLSVHKLLFVTGKNWPQLYEIEVARP